MTERDIVAILGEKGPLTGAELVEQARMDVLPLWQTCRRSSSLLSEIVGKRYLRLDRAVADYARLSPSIRREFLTYTVVGQRGQAGAIRERASRLASDVREISQRKIGIARESVVSAFEPLPERDALSRALCTIIAGDVVYDMAHAVPRPEPSTERMVRGSDLDIVFVAPDDLPKDLIQLADDAVYKKKHYLLVHPDHREEIDYLIKDLSRVRKQMRFDTFEAMVACKILDEGRFLWGNRDLFHAVKNLLRENRIHERLVEMEARAIAARAEAEKSLRDMPPDAREAEYLNLFYTSEEREEIY